MMNVDRSPRKSNSSHQTALGIEGEIFTSLFSAENLIFHVSLKSFLKVTQNKNAVTLNDSSYGSDCIA